MPPIRRFLFVLLMLAAAAVLTGPPASAAANTPAGVERLKGKAASQDRAKRQRCVRPIRRDGRSWRSAKRSRLCARSAGRKIVPDTRITVGPATGSTSSTRSASFSFTSTVTGSSFSCSLDGAGYSACTSPRSYNNLADGTHTFRVRATKSGQTDSTPASVSWTVAAAPPAPVATATPAPTATPTATPTAAPSAPAQPQTSWTAVGAAPLSDAAAAARVTRRPENRPANAAANAYVPTDAELNVFYSGTNQWGQTNLQVNPLAKYVTGRPGLSNPSTDDLIQWTAHKWGIPEDWIRAEMALESWWNQSALGDRYPVGATWSALYPQAARISGSTDVMQSMGVMQVKWIPDGSVGAGTEPLRWKSVAFNLDYYGSVTRFYYDGHCNWCTSGYSAGQQWNSIGAWFAPYPWNNADAQSYVQKVQGYLSERVWAKSGF
jgi:hypothetical protein